MMKTPNTDDPDEHSGPHRNSTVLVDTTLQIEQQKIEPRPQVVREALAGFKFRATSTYSRLEAKRSWVKRLAYIHEESKHVATIPQLLDRINTKLGSNPYLRRKHTTAVEAISACMDKVRGNLSEKARLERFRYFVVDAVLSINTWWDRSVDHEFDGTRCVRAKEISVFDKKAETIKAGVARCIRSKIQCNIHGFAVENMGHFDKIMDAISAGDHGTGASAELKTALVELTKAKADPERLCDDQVCRKIGDCLIAVDGITMSHFASTNDREWEPLAKVLGKQYLNPKKSQDLPLWEST